MYWRNWFILSFFGLLEVVDPSQEAAEALQGKGLVRNTEEEVILSRAADGEGKIGEPGLTPQTSLTGARPSLQSPQILSLGRTICLPRAAKGDDSFPDPGGGSDPLFPGTTEVGQLKPGRAGAGIQPTLP